jgi:hypothetical protein
MTIKNSDSFNCLLNRLDEIGPRLRAEFIHECIKAGNLNNARTCTSSPDIMMNYHTMSFRWDGSRGGQLYWETIHKDV